MKMLKTSCKTRPLKKWLFSINVAENNKVGISGNGDYEENS